MQTVRTITSENGTVEHARELLIGLRPPAASVGDIQDHLCDVTGCTEREAE